MPLFHGGALESVVAGALRHVDRVLVVDDGASPDVAAQARALSGVRVAVLALGGNHGKGYALAAAFGVLGDEVAAILTLDADGQHPADRIPAFLAAAEGADVVVGRRRDRRRGGMPPVRRAANAVSSRALGLTLRRRTPDAQCGMRLLRTDVLRRIPLEGGGFEAETRHLKALVRGGATIAWVDIPTIYGGEPSAFRAVTDSARIGREIVRTGMPAPAGGGRNGGG